MLSWGIVAQQPQLVTDYNEGPENGISSMDVAYTNDKMVMIVMNEEYGKE